MPPKWEFRLSRQSDVEDLTVEKSLYPGSTSRRSQNWRPKWWSVPQCPTAAAIVTWVARLHVCRGTEQHLLPPVSSAHKESSISPLSTTTNELHAFLFSACYASPISVRDSRSYIGDQV